MKHKKLLIVLVVVAALAAGALAYAAFTSTASTDPYFVSTGTSGLDITGTHGWYPTGGLCDLMPAIDGGGFGSDYARELHVCLENNGATDFQNIALSASLTSNPRDVGSVLMVAVKGPDDVVQGPFSVDQFISGSVNLGPLAEGDSIQVCIAVWLDQNAGDQFQGLEIDPGLTFIFTGT